MDEIEIKPWDGIRRGGLWATWEGILDGFLSATVAHGAMAAIGYVSNGSDTMVERYALVSMEASEDYENLLATMRESGYPG